jgi:CubicO group peptidase (beta-lactamase class C family)
MAFVFFTQLFVGVALAAAPTAEFSPWSEKADVQLTERMKFFFENEKSNSAGQTDALLIYKKGELVFERYAHGYSREKKHLSWSMAKSFSTTLYGILLQKNLVKPTDTVDQFFPEVKNTEWKKVQLIHLATMSSGMAWEENYDLSPLNSHVAAMLYRAPYFSHMGEYRLKQMKRLAPPGERFSYGSGETNLLTACLQKRIPNGDWIAFVRENLFGPIGISKFTLELDEGKNFIGSSYLYLTPRDYLKFGVLLLKKGMWDGKSVLSENWLKEAVSPAAPFGTLRLDNDPQDRAYGQGFWLNQPVGSAQIGRAHKSLPDDAFYAKGYQGQYILVVPSEDLVVVRLGHDNASENRFRLDDFRAALKGEKS